MARIWNFSLYFVVSFTSICISFVEAEPTLQVLRRPFAGKVLVTAVDSHQSDIYGIDFSSGEVIVVLSSSAMEESPAFSPNGKQFAFYADFDGDREIYVGDIDSGGIQRITRNRGIDEDPYFSSDGRKIIFRSERGKGSNLYVYDFQTGNEEKVTSTHRTNSYPRWSPKDDFVLYSTTAHWPGWDIEMVNLQSGKIDVLTSGIHTSCRAAWSPDALRYSYSYGGGKTVNLWLGSFHGQDEQLTNYAGKDYDSLWIDNDRILFVRELHRGKEDYQLFLLSLSTKETLQLTEGSLSLRNPSYSSVGGRLRPFKTPMRKVRK